MSETIPAFDEIIRRDRFSWFSFSRFRKFPSSALYIAGALALSLFGGFRLAAPPQAADPAPAREVAARPTPINMQPMGRMVGLRPVSAPVTAETERSSFVAPSVEAPPEKAAVALVEPASAPAFPPTPPERPFDASAPTPPRRPAELASLTSPSPSASAPAAASPRSASRLARAAAPAAPAEMPSIFERLLGETKSASPALAYAAPETGETRAPRGVMTSATSRYDNFTAVYDISAHTVYLPDGTRLEAHSGLRERLDDPRYVHEKMRGATPPSVYDLSLREQLFHGVQALRLTPLSGSVFGRAGLLAHTYMLGPNGDSNGCVSFRDYAAFLRAYRSGQVKRLAVVARLN